MLTRLRVHGFKNLRDVEIYFGPFTCIAGPNAAGKSNIFDAIRFLHLLTQHSIMDAASRIRESSGRSSDPVALLTTLGGFQAPEMRFSVDLVVDREVEDDFGVSAKAAISTFRYEVAFQRSDRDGVSVLELSEEALLPLSLGSMHKGLGFKTSRGFRNSCLTGRRPGKLISTEVVEGGPQITTHQEGHGGRRRVLASKSSITVVGGTVSAEFPSVLAVHREMESWQTLLLEPTAMRSPSSYRDPDRIDPRGAHLPRTLARLTRMETSPGSITSELSNRLAEIVDGVHEIRLSDDTRRETWTVEAAGRDGVFHPASALSDGTLRFLTLATIERDPKVRGLLCLEEPENGIHPARIPGMVDLLTDIAVDTEIEVSDGNPLRQVVINTHSPEVVTQVSPEDFVYLEERQTLEGRVAAIRVPYASWRRVASSSSDVLVLTPSQAQAYLLKPDLENIQLWLPFGHPETSPTR